MGVILSLSGWRPLPTQVKRKVRASPLFTNSCVVMLECFVKTVIIVHQSPVDLQESSPCGSDCSMLLKVRYALVE